MLRIGGLITAKKQVMTKRNDQMAILTLEDYTHTVSVVVFPKTYGKYMNATAVDMAVYVRGRADVNDESVQIIAEEVLPLGESLAESQPVQSSGQRARQAAAPQWHDGMGTKLFIKIPAHLERTDLSVRIGKVLKAHHGPVQVYLHLAGSRRTILTDEKFWVTTDDDLRRELEKYVDCKSLVVQ